MATLALSNHAPCEDAMRYRYHHTILLVIAVCITGMFVGNYANDFYMPVAMAFPKSTGESDQPPRIVQRDRSEGMSNIPWFCAGAIIGGFACVGFRRLKDKGEAARYFGVSVGASLFTAPAMVYRIDYFNPPMWYDCLLATGLMASFAWAIVELLTLLFKSIYDATQQRGIAGFRDQIILILSLGIIGKQQQASEQKPAPNPEEKK